MENQVSGYRRRGVIMVKGLKKEKVGKRGSDRLPLRPPGRGGNQLAC